MGERARGYAWPPFEAGNTAALTHGARSPRMVRPIAERLMIEAAEVAPWVARRAFGPELEAWAWHEARARLLRAWLDEHGLLDEDDGPRGALGELQRAENAAAKARDRLGLNPLAWARLRAAVEQAGGREDLEDLDAEGRAILEIRGREP